MPYVITTYGRQEVYGTPNAVVARSRRAVATLDDQIRDRKREKGARSIVDEIVRERRDAHREGHGRKTLAQIVAGETEHWATGRSIISAIGPDGGTIGPLPDGTVIEVEPITWLYLAEFLAMLDPQGIADDAEREPLTGMTLLDAYNAAQEVRA